MKTKLLASLLTTTLVSGASAIAKRPMPPPDSETVAAQMFSQYDADENNALTETELISAFEGIRAQHRAERMGTRCNQGPGANKGMRPRRGGRGPRPAADFAPSLIEDFDADGDSALNPEELLEALDFMHSMRFRGGPPPVDGTTEADADGPTA